MKLRLYFLIVLLSLLLTGCAIDNAMLLTLQGRNQFELGHPEQARLWYDQAIALDPTFAEAYFHRAATYVSIKAYDQAIADLDRAIALRPKWAGAYASRALAYLFVGDTKQAHKDFEMAVALDPNLPTKYEQRLDMCYLSILDKDMLKEGIPDITAEQLLESSTNAIEQDSSNVEAYFCRAVSYIMMGNFEKVVADLDRVIELNPGDAMAYYHRAVAYTQTEDMTEPDMLMKVRLDLDRAIELEPDFACPYWLRGLIQSLSTDGYPGAIEDYETFLALAPDTPMYAEMRRQADESLAALKSEYSTMLVFSAEDLRQRGRIDAAIVGFDEAIRINPNNADAYNGRAMAYFTLGDHERAFEDFEKAIELAPEDPLFYFNRGIANGEMAQWDAAIADYDKAIALEQTDTDFYNARGFAYAELGEDARAIEDFDRAIELDAKNPNPYLNRGKALLRAGEYERAIADLDRAIELESDWATTYLNRGKAYAALGKYDQAVQDLEQYLALSPNAQDHEEIEGLIAIYQGRTRSRT